MKIQAVANLMPKINYGQMPTPEYEMNELARARDILIAIIHITEFKDKNMIHKIR
jgi:hypothetical protein